MKSLMTARSGLAITLGLLSCFAAQATSITINLQRNEPPQPLHGGIGVATWDTKAEFRDIVVQTTEKTLFQSGFANNLDGWQPTGGEWKMSGGVLSQNSRAISCQIITGENTWSNYTYSLKARRTEGTEGFLIIFAAENKDTLYWWNIGGWGNTRTAIEKKLRGSKREISGTAVDLRIEDGTWYDIKIAVHDTTAECYFDGRLITTITADKGTSTMADAGPPKVVNNGNGPEPVRTVVRAVAGRGSGPLPSGPILDSTGNVITPGQLTAPVEPSPTPKLEDPTSWIAKPNGCLIEQSGNKIHISGINNINGWGHGNIIRTTKTIPQGSFYATVDFMVPQFKGAGNALVYLRAHANTGIGNMVAILYQPNAGTYQVQGWGIQGAPNTFSQPSARKLGDEDKVFHRMKLKYDAATQTAAGWVDDQFIGSLKYEMTGEVYFELLANTEAIGMQIDLLFENLTITPDISQAPPTPERNKARSGDLPPSRRIAPTPQPMGGGQP